MTQLKFGDIDALLKVYKSKPHLMEIIHECDCIHCEYDGMLYECSRCGRDDMDEDEFIVNGDYKCPGCGEKLLSESDLNNLIASKKLAYTKK